MSARLRSGEVSVDAPGKFSSRGFVEQRAGPRGFWADLSESTNFAPPRKSMPGLRHRRFLRHQA